MTQVPRNEYHPGSKSQLSSSKQFSQHVLGFTYIEKMFPSASHFSVNVPFRSLSLL